MGPFFYFFLYFFIAMSPLVGAQILMTWLYGWRGLVSTTIVLVFLMLGGAAMLIALERGRLDIGPPPRALVELVVGFTFLFPLSLLVPLFIVLVAFLSLALTVKTEQSSGHT
jgi:hypothetical protein